jgi:hypothetical protein
VGVGFSITVSYGSESRQQAFARGLDSGNRTLPGFGDFDQSLRAGFGGAYVEMVPHHVQERVAAHELARAINRVSVARGLLLHHEPHGARVRPGSPGIRRFVSRPDHYADLLDVGGHRLFDENTQNGLLASVPIDYRL